MPLTSPTRRIRSERSAEPIPFSSPRLDPAEGPPPVSLRSLKRLATKLAPSHPIRALLLNEPDEIPWDDYVTKASIWSQLLALKVD
jgi:hypothetical protein